ncbi:MAG: hypothetical protein HYV07_27500 [Deltaproteobacteria bacterium]|nr:hypothetical protein [Deltaproteobacteria bacterium]
MARDLGFGIQVFTAFGTEGSFIVGSGEDRTVARYLLTKIRPGNDGTWETSLARKLRPWREVFAAGRVTFDELLQRDLDDSRVAMDLIPYLLGEGKHAARFFPPIVAIVVPRQPDGVGIQDFYPALHAGTTAPSIRFGNLLRIDPFLLADGESSPISELTANEASAAFVIADGQHRAMAVLALHRILTGGWESNPYAAYYQHIQVTPDQVRGIELPVCIVTFPELTAGRNDLVESGKTLTKVCRDLFLTVNKTAKPVSKSRQLLLDDEDLAAILMRRSLSELKSRDENISRLARIYSFAFGDAQTDLIAQGVSGRLEFSSAQLLHRVHSATCFTNPGNLDLDSDSNLTDARRLNSPSAGPDVLRGTAFGEWNSIGRFSAALYTRVQVDQIVALLGTWSDIPIFALFDSLSMFVAHNEEMQATKIRLADPSMRADPIQAKCQTLLFEGSGARGIFDEHVERLDNTIRKFREAGQEPPPYCANQEQDVRAIRHALELWTQRVKRGRALRFLGVEPDGSEEHRESVGDDAVRLSRELFDTPWTQAFQLGFTIGVHGMVRCLLEAEPVDYSRRIALTKALAEGWVAGLNAYWSRDDVQHRTVTQDMRQDTRFGVFDTDRRGLRAVHALSVKELNEREYSFFRYAVLELVHSKRGLPALLKCVGESADICAMYRAKLPTIAKLICDMRKSYLEAGQRTALGSNEAKIQIALVRAEAERAGRSADEDQARFEADRRAGVAAKFSSFLEAAVDECTLDPSALCDRMNQEPEVSA